jgi:hypothetical protein
VLLRDPELWERWVTAANLMLLAELRRRAPHAIDWTTMGDVVPLLDAFEAAMDSKIVRGIDCALDGAMTGPRGRSPDVGGVPRGRFFHQH